MPSQTTSQPQKRIAFRLKLLTLTIFVLFSFQETSGKAILDFDGDGKTDYAVNRGTDDQDPLMYWYISLSSGGSIIQQFGLGSISAPRDKTLPEDYNGDGMCDIAVYRHSPGGGVLYVLETGTNAVTSTSLPGFHTTVIAQDYDGDGRADVADTWHNENDNMIWRILESKTGKIRTVYFGIFSSDVPLKGDFDGDGSADVAVYRKNTYPTPCDFYVLRSSDGVIETKSFGTRWDRPTQADYDGDGKTDYAVTRDDFDAGEHKAGWYWIESSTDAFRSILFGGLPVGEYMIHDVPGDYDGDRKTDQAVARREGQKLVFYVNGSLSGPTARHWGMGTDTGLVNAYFPAALPSKAYGIGFESN